MQVLEGTSPMTRASSQAEKEKAEADRHSCPLQRPTTGRDTSQRSNSGVASVSSCAKYRPPSKGRSPSSMSYRLWIPFMASESEPHSVSRTPADMQQNSITHAVHKRRQFRAHYLTNKNKNPFSLFGGQKRVNRFFAWCHFLGGPFHTFPLFG